MISNPTAELYYDPFDYDIDDDPYPVWKRMRAEAPLYFNDKYGFYASAATTMSRKRFRTGRPIARVGALPQTSCSAASKYHRESCCSRILRSTTLHRRLLSRVFTPRRMLAVESLVRDFCSRAWIRCATPRASTSWSILARSCRCAPSATCWASPSKGRSRSAIATTRALRSAHSRTALASVSPTIFEDSIALFAEYIEWRATHPSDDLMTELLNAPSRRTRRIPASLERTEVLAYTAMIAGAGNETTARLIGFMGQLLGEHPDQRRELVADPSLIPSAVEETLRYEPPSPVQARYVARDVELYGGHRSRGVIRVVVQRVC